MLSAWLDERDSRARGVQRHQVLPGFLEDIRPRAMTRDID